MAEGFHQFVESRSRSGRLGFPTRLPRFGYVQQDREEMEVLFTLLAERYERHSVMITTNLVFSKWDQIFNRLMKNPVLRWDCSQA